MTAPDSPSTSYDVGYGKPPKHTQFRKGQSGNPGGRPRRDKCHDVRRLKALTLQEAYRGVIIGEGGVPVPAIQAILRSQIKLAINGDFRAQRALLTAVEGFENEDEEAAALEEYVELLAEKADEYRKDELAKEMFVEKMEDREGAASTAVKKMSYAEAGDRIMFLLRMGKYAVKSESETGTPGNETVAENAASDAGAAPQQQPPENAPPPGSDMPPSPPSAASAPPAPAPRSDRHAGHRAQQPAPSPSPDADLLPDLPGGKRNKGDRNKGGLNKGGLGNSSPHQRTKNSAQAGRGTARPAAGIQKLPVNYPVLREPAPASRKPQRQRRERGG
jgi:hypothetical protein